MKIRLLFVFTVSPNGNLGASRRTQQTAALLSRFASVTAVLASESDFSAEELGKVSRLFGNLEYIKLVRRRRRSCIGIIKHIFSSKNLEISPVEAPEEGKRRISHLVEEHDAVWIHTLKAANAFRKYEWKNSVLDLDDVPSKWLRLAASLERNPLRRLALVLDARLRRRGERHLQDRFRVAVLCDPEDRNLFQDPARVHAIANGFDGKLDRKCWVPSGSRRLGMIGAYGYLPNRDGIVWFLNNVWPKLRQSGDFELVLVGKGGEEIVAKFPNCGVSARGFVEDLADEVKGWAGMIVPTRMGGGTHVKVAEGMAMGLPMVSTSHGCRGYDVANGREMAIADGEDEFAAACVALIQSAELQERLSRESRAYFEKYLTWDAIAPDVERALLAAL